MSCHPLVDLAEIIIHMQLCSNGCVRHHENSGGGRDGKKSGARAQRDEVLGIRTGQGGG